MPVDPNGDSHIEKLNVFSQLTKLDKLKYIDIDLTHTKESNEQQYQLIAQILNRILLAGADTIEEIILRTPIGYLPELRFPKMANVMKLQLLFNWDESDTFRYHHLESGQLFPKGFKFTDLPKLEDVIFNLEIEDSKPKIVFRFDCWNDNLKSCRIAESVKNIEYNDDCLFLTKRLRKTFPNAIFSETSDLNSELEDPRENPEEYSDDDSEKD